MAYVLTLCLKCPFLFHRFKFKALELNKKILEGAVMPKKPAPKESTQPEAFHLETDRRIQERQASRKPEEPQDCTFHPRPVPLRILEDVVVRTIQKYFHCFMGLFWIANHP